MLCLFFVFGCAGVSLQGTTQEVGSERLQALVNLPDVEHLATALSTAGMSSSDIATVLQCAVQLPQTFTVMIYQLSGDAANEGQWQADLRAWLARSITPASEEIGEGESGERSE
jgi:hypothetical protein